MTNKPLRYYKIIKSIVVPLGIAMLLSCENNIKEVDKLTKQSDSPSQEGKNIEYIYTDSTRITYRAIVPEFKEIIVEENKFNEFVKGGQIIYYNKDGSEAWNIKCKYAKNNDKEQLWELRNDVVAVSNGGRTINTELMFWDQKKKLIYSDKYVRITQNDGQILHGTSFKADDKLERIQLSKVNGKVLLEDKTQKK
jgi:LPS export ABC transporter protein LptC